MTPTPVSGHALESWKDDFVRDGATGAAGIRSPWAMKNWGWIVAGLAFVAFVFAMSFVAQFNPESGKGQVASVTPSTSEARALEPRFVTRQIPDGDADALPQEQFNAGFQDYWFINPHTTPVRFGLEGKKCTCTGVQVFVVPSDHPWWKGEGAAFVKDGQPLVDELQKQSKSPQLTSLLKSLEGVELLGRSESSIPPAIDLAPGQAGFVRMGWKNEKVQRDVMSATLWIGKPENRNHIRLEAAIHTHPVLYLLDDFVDLGTLNANDRSQAEGKLKIVLPTREKLPLKAEILNASPKERIILGEASPLTGEGLGALRKEVRIPVKAAYTISVKASWKAPGEEYPEIGPFIKRVEVSTDEPGVNAQAQRSTPVRVFGKVEGDIEVVGTNQRGHVMLNRFERQEGSKAEAALESKEPGLVLKIDRQRTASFLDAEIDKSPKRSGDRFRWRLLVKVGPGKVSGEFPRGLDPNPAYRDSAVYVTIDGQASRTVRIPVEGRADN
jgi:hypothetical protein